MRFNYIWLTSAALVVCAASVSAQTTGAGARQDTSPELQTANAQYAAEQKKTGSPQNPASPSKPAPPQKPAPPTTATPPPRPAAPTAPATTQKPDDEQGVHFVMERRPSLRFGDKARIDFRLKAHGDYRSFSPDLRREDRFDLRRLRAGVEGEVLKNVQYEVEYDFREDDYPLRDAFVDIRTSAALQIRGGKFKQPFSREELTGAMNLDFAFRSRAADQLSPGRAVGAMAHGRLLNRRLQYQVGLFREDGENTRRNPLRLDADAASAATDDPTVVPGDARAATWAVRGTFRGAGAWSALEVGAAMTTGAIREGRNSVRGRMVFGGGFFPAFEVNGRRQRLGIEGEYDVGPVTVSAEWMRVRDERLGQGFDNEDLAPLIARGWYVAGTWLAAGRKPGDDADRPAARAGALELAARYEGLRFGSAMGAGDEPSRSPRAAVIFPNADRAWTWGANWYVNQLIRVQGNIIREQLENAARAPIPSQAIYWSAIVRIQFVL